MTYDGVPEITRFAKRRKIKFPVLADKGSEVIRAFGLLNEDYPAGSYAHGVAHPIVIVFDENGIVTHRFSRAGYVRRPNIDAVISALKKTQIGSNSETPSRGSVITASDEDPSDEQSSSIWNQIKRAILNN